MEPHGVFLDMSFNRDELFVDEGGGLLILMRLGIQPRTGPSSRRCAEVEQNRLILLFGLKKRLIDVLAPIYRHIGLRSLMNSKPIQ
jgi:hypothetical protein